MSSTATATMIVILGMVWGGFLLILATAFVKERRKASGEAARSERASLS
ncbi:MAG TPA: hypothetical protein VKA44_05785 [Gemmatimonadota bacterium]|nr:hypothetical protein [Gemmatimonadota bacterium]